jgi:hypothetical protein
MKSLMTLSMLLLLICVASLSMFILVTIIQITAAYIYQLKEGLAFSYSFSDFLYALKIGLVIGTISGGSMWCMRRFGIL